MKHTSISKIIHTIHFVLDIITPGLCGNCGKDTHSSKILCDYCADSIIIRKAPQKLGNHLLFAATDYQNQAAQNLIKIMKYDGVLKASASIADIILKHLDIAGIKGWLPSDKKVFIVPIPIHFIKKWHRGFNQSEVLANIVGKALNISVMKALKRRVYTPPQSQIADDRVRYLNIKNCFVLSSKAANIPPKSIIIILDDVVTSGGTIKEAAKTLKPLRPSQIIFVSALSR